MTSQASRLLDTVDEMLLDAGQAQDTNLRAALLSLGSLASVPAPPPNAQLAALLGSRPDELSWRRRLRRHRTTIVSLAVVAGMGLGVTGVAASASGPAEKSSVSVQHLLEDWAPSWSLSELPLAATGAGLLPNAEPEQAAPAGQDAAADSGGPGGHQESPASKAPDQATPPGKSPGVPGNTGSADGGADAHHRPATAAAGTESSGTGPAAAEPKIPGQPGTLPDTTEAAATTEEAARQELEKSAKLMSGVVPEKAVAGGPGEESARKSGIPTKADPGAKWLKKFNR